MERESMEVDVVIVGAGPSGLAAAIRLKQLAAEAGRDIEVTILEKGSEVGAHILSGAVLDPRALNELIPDWKEKGAPLNAPVKDEKFLILSEGGGLSLPTFMLPPVLKNHGNYIISLGNLCRWLGELAESMGVEIYPGFAASEVLYNDDGSVKGVVTGDMGVTREGEQGPNYQVGMELHAKYTFFAEGCRGSLGKQLMEKFNLREGVEPQTYGIGIKELWEIEPEKHQEVLLFTRRVGRYRPIPTVVRSSITWKTIKSPSVSWSGWTMRIPISALTRNFSDLRCIRRSSRISKAAAESLLARGR